MGVNKRGYPKGDPDLQLSRDYYDEIYKKSITGKVGYYKPWNEHGARLVTWYPALVLAEPPILDVGCGAGHLAAMCAAFGIAYAGGIDYSARAIKLAREQHAPRARFVQGSIHTSPELTTTSYKTAVMLEVLEHVYEDLKLIERIPSGRIVVGSVPSFHVDGHCRWFAHAGEVNRRYRGVLNIDIIVTERGLSSDNQFFIFKGTRP